MTEEDNSTTKIIIGIVGLTIIAMIAYMIFRESRMQPLSQTQSLSQLSPEIQLMNQMNQKLSILDNKIDNLELKHFELQKQIKQDDSQLELVEKKVLSVNTDIRNRFKKAPSYFGMIT